MRERRPSISSPPSIERIKTPGIFKFQTGNSSTLPSSSCIPLISLPTMFRSSLIRFTQNPSLPYSIQRNSRGSIPVYTDIRNAGTRYLLLIRNVEGNVNVRPSTSPHPPLRVFVIESNSRVHNTRCSSPYILHLTYSFACFAYEHPSCFQLVILTSCLPPFFRRRWQTT